MGRESAFHARPLSCVVRKIVMQTIVNTISFDEANEFSKEKIIR